MSPFSRLIELLKTGSLSINDIRFQRAHWQQELKKSVQNINTEFYGYGWGDPERSDDPLGDYRKIKDVLLSPYVTDSATVMEIGCLGGKWTQYLTKAKSIVLVDLDDYCFKWLQPKLKHNNVVFYKTRGDELSGILGGSIDLIFSMDTFVRIPKKAIFSYFRDFQKVLKGGGGYCYIYPAKKYKALPNGVLWI